MGRKIIGISGGLYRYCCIRGDFLYCPSVAAFTDPTGGYKCFRRRALQAVNLDKIRSNEYSFQIEMTHKLWRHGFKIVEVPIIFTERAEGRSKMARHIVSEAFWMVWRLWLQNGLRRSPRAAK